MPKSAAVSLECAIEAAKAVAEKHGDVAVCEAPPGSAQRYQNLPLAVAEAQGQTILTAVKVNGEVIRRN